MQLEYTLSNIHKTAEKLWSTGKCNCIWAFYGELGAGKTTLIHALCEVLKVEDNVSSPTFAIINEYKSPVAGPVYHMDLYRLKDENEAIEAGVEDYLTNDHLCLIEWSEKVKRLLPDDIVKVYIEVIDADTRKLTVEIN